MRTSHEVPDSYSTRQTGVKDYFTRTKEKNMCHSIAEKLYWGNRPLWLPNAAGDVK